MLLAEGDDASLPRATPADVLSVAVVNNPFFDPVHRSESAEDAGWNDLNTWLGAEADAILGPLAESDAADDAPPAMPSGLVDFSSSGTVVDGTLSVGMPVEATTLGSAEAAGGAPDSSCHEDDVGWVNLCRLDLGLPPDASVLLAKRMTIAQLDQQLQAAHQAQQADAAAAAVTAAQPLEHKVPEKLRGKRRSNSGAAAVAAPAAQQVQPSASSGGGGGGGGGCSKRSRDNTKEKLRELELLLESKAAEAARLVQENDTLRFKHNVLAKLVESRSHQFEAMRGTGQAWNLTTSSAAKGMPAAPGALVPPPGGEDNDSASRPTANSQLHHLATWWRRTTGVVPITCSQYVRIGPSELAARWKERISELSNYILALEANPADEAAEAALLHCVGHTVALMKPPSLFDPDTLQALPI